MEEGHELMLKVLHRFWEKHAINMSAFETLSLIDWVNTYLLELRNFGITDVYLQNGLTNLCNAYSRKIQA